jgi:hypothetical protein
MLLSAIVPLNYAWMSAIVLIVLFAGFRNLPMQGRCWGLVLKCYESRTRQHTMLIIIKDKKRFMYKIQKTT